MRKLFAIIVSAAAVFTLYAATTTAEDLDLVLEYHFEGDSACWVYDSGPNGLDARIEPFDANGTLVKSPERVDEGKVGKALKFDGSNMLKVDHHDSFIMQDFTLMAWVWYTWEDYPPPELGEKPEVRQEIMEKFGAFWMNIRRDTGLLRVGFPISPCSNGKYNIGRWDSSNEIPEKEWTHVAATFDFESKSVEIYIDGEKDEEVVKQFSLKDWPCPSIQPLIIGGRYAKKEICDKCPDAFFKGKIDEVRIYSRILNSEEIKELMLSEEPYIPAEKPCDGRAEIIGTWDSGIWYRDVAKSKWTKMTPTVPLEDITAGDFTGDRKADVASIWSSGLWYQNGASRGWTQVSPAAPDRIAAGDITGDGRDEIIGCGGAWSLAFGLGYG